jgi:hypothetical protein
MSTYSELLAIYESFGRLTPALVVDCARPVESPLHDRFEWDDSRAAEGYRREQASELIRSQKVTYAESSAGEQRSVRSFHSVSRAEGQTYVPVPEVVADDFTYQMVLNQMKREWNEFRKRYEHLAEFREITAQMAS